MNRYEKILFYRIEAWLVLLALPILLIILIVFGAMVRSISLYGNSFGAIGEAAYSLASFSSNVRKIIVYEDPHSISAEMSLQRNSKDAEKSQNRFEGRSGFKYFYEKKSGGINDYLLMSRFDGDKKVDVVELYDLANQVHLYTWPIHEDAFRDEQFENSFITFPNQKNIKLRIIHPLLETDGSLVFHAGDSPLYIVNSCGVVKWRNSDFAYHHSLERDEEGNYWSPGMRETKLETFDEKYMDDHIVKVSSMGHVLYSKSVTEILIENELIYRVRGYGQYITDPIHLNDVQPVTEDSEYWKKGDVFLSLGHLNMIMLFRPGTNKLIWWSEYAIMTQHDVDVAGDGKITVFNNNRTTRAGGDMVIGLNELLAYDFSEGAYSRPYQQAFHDNEIRTMNQGLHDYSSDGKVMIEETNFGRLLMFDQKDMYWEYINRGADGKIYTTNWSRLISNEDGRLTEKSIDSTVCN